jgi:NTP pyrophosphatase (non-canonical NTP hydrolase)
MKTLNDYANECCEIAKSKGWYDTDKDTLETKLLLVHSEISEAVEEIRNGHAPNEIYFSDKGKPEGAPVEIVDALIRIFDLAKKWDMDLEKAYQIKTEYNKSRPYRHGKTM